MTENRAALIAEINTNVYDNTTGAVTPYLIRQTLLDIVANIATLLDAQTFASVQTFGVPPIVSGLTGFLYGNGTGALTALTAAQASAAMGTAKAAKLVFTVTGVNLNATGDTVIPITLPIGFTRFKVAELHVSNASTSLTTAKVALYTAASQGGVNIVTQTLTNITSTSPDTNLNAYSATIVNAGTISYNDANLYLNVGTAQGAAATADVTLIVTPLP